MFPQQVAVFPRAQQLFATVAVGFEFDLGAHLVRIVRAHISFEAPDGGNAELSRALCRNGQAQAKGVRSVRSVWFGSFGMVRFVRCGSVEFSSVKGVTNYCR